MSETRIACPAEINQETGKELWTNVRAKRPSEGDSVLLDFSETTHMDSKGGAWLIRISDYLQDREASLGVEGHSGQVAEFYDLIQPGMEQAARVKPPEMGPIEKVGGQSFKVAAEFKEILDLTSDAIYWTFIAPFMGRGFRWGLMLDEMHEMGVRAVRVTFVMNFLLGLTIAMLSAAQVADFGLGIYVADLIIIGFARELAALMTAIVVSARTGAAIAAELATMKVQEEIDALRGMGINVAQYLVAPKLLALLVVMPILVSIGLVAGIIGGSVWGIYVLGFAPAAWLHETQLAASLDDFVQGGVKAIVFAIVIVLVGCHNGLRVRGGSRGVGLMTTRSVVMDIFFIVFLDMIFAALFYYILD